VALAGGKHRADTPDWQHIAVQLYRHDGMCKGLTGPERDALLTAVREAPGEDLTMPYRDAVAGGFQVGDGNNQVNHF